MPPKGEEGHSNAAKLTLIDKLKSFQTDLDTPNKKLFGLHYRVDGEDSLDEIVKGNEENYERIEASIEWVQQDITAAPASPLLIQIGNPGSKLKLPTIPLTEFKNAKGDDLQKFLQAFELVIDKHDPSQYEKFLYLRE